ncbi:MULTISPECIES: hypothetical protein [Pseudonocardia]|uniref:Anti-sigma factor n=2 Tax=Pseudonocardia TaxID=1847 RepID=A0ABS6V0F6_9PSEU|nr:hypothetical protein [Pseudonocardia abyssalis]MBW0118942.1 hypothetical protein [Pseudonocardia abyssalis]MBW0137988.1 hypothetical protein [Pseudonocardia abyssalis]
MSARCRDRRPELVDVARGTAAPSPGLLAHLDGCPDCATELRELTAVAAAMARADPAALRTPGAHTSGPQPSGALGARVVAAVRARRRRRTVTAALAAAAVVLALAGGAAVLVTRAAPAVPATTVALSVVETPVPWGTRLQIEATGLPAGGPFRVWVEDATGTRTPVGSFGPTDDGRASVPAATELAPGGIRRVGLSTAGGEDLAAVDA